MSENLQFHEAANLFPMIEPHAFDEFKADIETNGLRDPIELYEGKIIDGRNRYLACLQLGIKCRTTTPPIDDPVTYVLSKNLHRRHMTPSQLAMVGDAARDLFDKQAKERQASAIKDRDEKGRAISTGGNVTTSGSGKARDAAGKAVGVSGSLIDHAGKVRKHGVPALAKAVEEGRMSVSTAAKLTEEPPEVQTKIAEQSTFTGGRYRTPKPPTKGTDGRPRNIPECTEAMEFAAMAISQMTRIRKDDPKRQAAFDKIITWIGKNRNAKK